MFLCPAAVAEESTPTGAEFFERKVRPVLVKHCLSCHGAEKHKGSLRLDVAEGWREGGDSGPAVVPGNPDESLLVIAVRHGGDVEMPPSGKLPEATIRLLEAWVARGAPGPIESRAAPAGGVDLEAGRTHWAYQPLRRPAVPAGGNAPGADASPIDRFLEARLKESGLDPAPAAERRTLLRRLSFDLWGLPPSPDEIDAFEKDRSPNAYLRVVDRLLASPRFGERWGRHWLDLVRYGESLTLRGFVFKEAWRYRDYVIDAFRSDRPYDEFVREQIAGDLLVSRTIDERRRRLVATTFWTLGNNNLEEQDKRQLDMDVVDEQLDVLGKSILAQTIGCARCHDHKFDPIPTRDYYALAGILANTRLLEHANVSKWIEAPIPLRPEEEAVHARHEAAVAALAKRLAAAQARVETILASHPELRSAAGAVVAARDLPGVVVDDRQAKKVGGWSESRSTKPYVGEGYLHDGDDGKGEKTLTFAPVLPSDGRYEVRLAYTPGSNRADRVPVTVFCASGEVTVPVNMKAAPPIDGRFVSLGEHRFEVAGQSYVLIENEGTRGHVVADAVQFLPRDGAAGLVSSKGKVDKAIAPPLSPAAKELAQEQAGIKRLERELRQLRAVGPERPMAMTIFERPEIGELRVHVRGSVHTLGEPAPRGFLQVVGPTPSTPLPRDQSGRRELADWIASPENPLTARVFVNRVWHWLFGAGLVPTVDNFGTMGEPPTHPELLDYLAAEFIEDGWSIKGLVRRIVLSAAYRRSAAATERMREIDPENRLLARARRKRLDAESLRDAMLSVSGELDLEIGGPTIKPGTTADYNYRDESVRRSVYLPVFRNALPGLFEAFDFPDPSLVVGSRNESTVAPQALYLLNDPFVLGRAAAAARRMLSRRLDDQDARIDWAFRCSLGRPPSADERSVVRSIVENGETSGGERERAWAEVFHLLFLSLDFRYYGEGAERG